MPIVVACKCGQQFRAKDEFAGRQMKCPKCASILQVPGGAAVPQQPAAPQGGTSSLDALMQMDQSAGMGMPQQGHPQQGMPQQGMPQQGMPGGFQQPGFQQGPGGFQQQSPFGGAYGGPPRGGNKSGSPARLIVGICAAVVIVIAGVVIAIKVSNNAEQTAKNEEINKRNAALADPKYSDVPNSGNIAPVDAGPANSNIAINDGADSGSGGSSGDPDNGSDSNGSENVSATEEEFPFGETDLTGATHKWIEKGDHLQGLLATEEEQIEILSYSWMTHLLPYVGGEELYDDFDLEESFYEGANRNLTSAEVFQFLNPNQETTRFEGRYFTGMGSTHFVGMSGAEDARNDMAARYDRSDPRAGVFGYDEIAKPNDITDGTSQTLMLIGSEKTAGPWVSAGGATVRGARQGRYGYLGGYFGFWSEGLAKPGALVALADGAVREVSEEIDPTIFRSLVTIAGGETDVNLDVLQEAEDDELPPGIRERVQKEGERRAASTQNSSNQNNSNGGQEGVRSAGGDGSNE